MDAILSSPTIGTLDPHADAVGPPLSCDVEARERAYEPLFEIMHEAPHVRLSALEIEHHIAHTLARPVIGVLAATASFEDRETGGEQVAVLGARSCGVKGRVLQQPHLFGCELAADIVDAPLHPLHGFSIGHGRRRNGPLDLFAGCAH